MSSDEIFLLISKVKNPIMHRESLQPALYTTSAHVFQIDPETKKSWMPISKQAVPVAFYYDSESSLYKISSTDGSKVCIMNSKNNWANNTTKCHFEPEVFRICNTTNALLLLPLVI